MRMRNELNFEFQFDQLTVVLVLWKVNVTAKM